MYEGKNNVLVTSNTNFSSTHGMSLFTFLFLGELGTCLQNLMPTRDMEPLKNHHFTHGDIEIHI